MERLIERIPGPGAAGASHRAPHQRPALADRLAKRLQAVYRGGEPLIGQAGVTVASHAVPAQSGWPLLQIG